MRQQSRTFITNFLKDHPKIKNVLEVGSRDIDGSVKDLFKDSKYIGLDMIQGDNVDVLLNAHDMEYVEKFDLIVCIDTLEHDDAFWITCKNIHRALKKGGWVIFGVPSFNCGYHGWPNDYWRFTEDSFRDFFLKDYVDTYREVQRDQPGLKEPDEVYGYGRKP